MASNPPVPLGVWTVNRARGDSAHHMSRCGLNSKIEVRGVSSSAMASNSPAVYTCACSCAAFTWVRLDCTVDRTVDWTVIVHQVIDGVNRAVLQPLALVEHAIRLCHGMESLTSPLSAPRRSWLDRAPFLLLPHPQIKPAWVENCTGTPAPPSRRPHGGKLGIAKVDSPNRQNREHPAPSKPRTLPKHRCHTSMLVAELLRGGRRLRFGHRLHHLCIGPLPLGT